MLLAAVACVIGALAGIPGPSASAANGPDGLPVVGTFIPGPINAQWIYKWGRPAWQDDYEGKLPKYYDIEGPGVVQDQYGMLTLNTTREGTVTATRDRRGYRTGRWEIRIRSRRYGHAAADFTVLTELVPARDRDQHCGAQNIALHRYRIGGEAADFYTRSLPGSEFTESHAMTLHDDEWHTFGVEVARDHVSWFVDSRVVTTEKRSAAFPDVPLTVRFTMQAEPGAQMNQSRMQMDWLRYFTLARRNAHSIAAPQAQKGEYATAC